nr:hypothetical protein [Lachnospiraceae bacterium]
KQQGMLENAVHVGDNYYTFDWAQPSSTPLIIGSVLFDATNNSDEENNGLLKAINSGKDAAVAVGNSWISTSPLQSLSDIMGGGEYNNDGGVAGNVLNEVIEFPQRFIPAQLGATARTMDPVIRDTYSNDSTLTGTLGNQVRALQSRIPQLSKKLPASYDTWGNERTRSDTKGEAFFAQNINPGQLGNKNETPLDAEITRIYEATGNKEVFPLSAARSLNLGNDGNIKLTNKQHSDYQKMLGQRSYKLAEELMNNRDFKALSDDEKAATLKKAYDLSNALAKEELFDYVTDNDGKLKAAYKEKGEKGAVEHLIDSAKATQLGLNVDTYQKKQAEYKGGAEQYAADKKKADALGLTVDTYNKKQSEYQGGAAQYAKDKQNAISGGFTDKDGNANMDAYEDAVEIFGNNQSKLSSYQSFRAKGYTKDAQKVPELMNNNSFTAEEKGKILRGTDPSKLGKAAKGMYDLGGYEGVYYYYLMKNLADTNQNGSVTKAERAALLNSNNQYVMQIPDDMYYYLGKNLK